MRCCPLKGLFAKVMGGSTETPDGGLKEETNGQEANGQRLPNRRRRRRQRKVMGRSWPPCRGNRRELAARSARRGGHQDGHEGGERKSDGVSHPGRAVVQI